MSHYQFDDVIYKTVAKNIKKYRELNNISIKDLALFASIDEKFLMDLESLEKELQISIYDLYKISVILNTSIDKFFQK